ncbi:hypothetical protein CASFOL_026589 [Castilleja foliolosa]|uniref:Amino acid transporter transmembrane domain-containing protein n=1 Tax=Castilleja foliolosa TaxID=1961234 RepID=A0ABD3CIF8_9LAMI
MQTENRNDLSVRSVRFQQFNSVFGLSVFRLLFSRFRSVFSVQSVFCTALIPTAISLYMFCYCSHPVFLTLYTSMKNKKNFSKVLITCFVISTIIYASMALLGYFMFGSEVQSQITLNLPTHLISSKVAIYTTLVFPLTKYALILTPIVEAIENDLLTNPKKWLRMLMRTGLVLNTMVVAMVLPFFGYLMALVGALSGVTASIFLPCLFICKISGIHKRLGVESIFILIIVLMGVFILILGTYTSVRDIVEQLI